VVRKSPSTMVGSPRRLSLDPTFSHLPPLIEAQHTFLFRDLHISLSFPLRQEINAPHLGSDNSYTFLRCCLSERLYVQGRGVDLGASGLPSDTRGSFPSPSNGFFLPSLFFRVEIDFISSEFSFSSQSPCLDPTRKTGVLALTCALTLRLRFAQLEPQFAFPFFLYLFLRSVLVS